MIGQGSVGGGYNDNDMPLETQLSQWQMDQPWLVLCGSRLQEDTWLSMCIKIMQGTRVGVCGQVVDLTIFSERPSVSSRQLPRRL